METQIKVMFNLINVLREAEEKLGTTFGERMGKLKYQVETNTEAIKDIEGLKLFPYS